MIHALRLLIFATALAVATPASAGEFAILKEEIAVARQSLVTMVLYRDKRGPDQQRLVKVSADAVSLHLAKIKAPSGKTAELKELKSTWEAFKTTRETELVPAIITGDRTTSERIGAGVQKARLDRMNALIATLDQ